MIMDFRIGTLEKLRREAYKTIKNPHFWIIFVMVTSILFLYYMSFPNIREHIGWLRGYRTFEYRSYFNGSLLYIPFIYTSIALGSMGLLITWITSLVIILPRVIYFTHSAFSLVTNIILLNGPVMAILLIFILLKWIENNKKTFLEREAQRQAFMSQILKAHEDERQNIAQELHDDTIQSLLALANRMQFLSNKKDSKLSSKVLQQLESFSNSIYGITGDIRRLCVRLRPSILDDLGLLEALRSLADNFNNNDMKAGFILNGDYRKLPPETEVTLYRFVQEALNNVYRHSEAKEVVIGLDFGTNTIKVMVHDNGKGFVVPKQINRLTENRKFGIIGMEERAKLLGGTFNINSELGEGTWVSLEFPVP